MICDSTLNVGQLLKSLIDLQILGCMRDVWGNDMAGWLVEALIDLIGIVTVSTFCLLIVLLLIWLERKVIARIQDRIGPNRVGGRYGLLQSVADALKLMTKEDITPDGADKVAFNLAPILIVIAALMMWAVVPFAPGVIGTDLNIGLFYILAVSSASVVCILLAGWGSNNKYALLGAFRSVAQLVSYEVPMVMALLIPIMLAGSMSTVGIIEAQGIPFILVAPLSALIFFISADAELGRTPFDLIEAESEIVAGFHTEYSGMKFAMFFLAEFVNTLFMSALFTTIYLGGWRFFGIERFPILGLVAFFLKTFLVYMLFIWLRGTFPRVRVDQLLNLNWKFLVPVTLVLILLVAIVDKILPANTPQLVRAAVHFVSNIALLFSSLSIVRRYARQMREEQERGRIQPPPRQPAETGHSTAEHHAPAAVH